jgi:hypothetical protein
MIELVDAVFDRQRENKPVTRKWHIDPDGNVDDEAMAFVEELKHRILERHPEATFKVRPGGENPTAIFL